MFQQATNQAQLQSWQISSSECQLTSANGSANTLHIRFVLFLSYWSPSAHLLAALQPTSTSLPSLMLFLTKSMSYQLSLESTVLSLGLETQSCSSPYSFPCMCGEVPKLESWCQIEFTGETEHSFDRIDPD